jgi:hypothetical protein
VGILRGNNRIEIHAPSPRLADLLPSAMGLHDESTERAERLRVKVHENKLCGPKRQRIQAPFAKS